MTLYSVISKVDHRHILQEYKKLEEHIQWPENSAKGKQTGLQYAENEMPEKSAVGSLRSSRIETEYSLITPLFKNTIFEEIINQYKMCRTRLMWVNPYSCYSIHKDQTKRLHIPLITNTECFFIFPDDRELVHLPLGNLYLVDTTKNHSFCNFSENPRLHLVGCIQN